MGWEGVSQGVKNGGRKYQPRFTIAFKSGLSEVLLKDEYVFSEPVQMKDNFVLDFKDLMISIYRWKMILGQALHDTPRLSPSTNIIKVGFM